jgi:hypothetical protein
VAEVLAEGLAEFLAEVLLADVLTDGQVDVGLLIPSPFRVTLRQLVSGLKASS